MQCRVHHRRQGEVGDDRRGEIKRAPPKVRLGVRSERLAPKGGVEAPATALAATRFHGVVHLLAPKCRFSATRRTARRCGCRAPARIRRRLTRTYPGNEISTACAPPTSASI